MTSGGLVIRCPTDNCWLLGLSEDFRGSVATRCRKCKVQVGTWADPNAPRLLCECGKWLATGVVESGVARLRCQRTGVLAEVAASGSRHIERPRPPSDLSGEDLVRLIEERWDLLRYDRARRSVAACFDCNRGKGAKPLLTA